MHCIVIAHTRLKHDAFNVFFIVEYAESRLRWTKIEMTIMKSV